MCYQTGAVVSLQESGKLGQRGDLEKVASATGLFLSEAEDAWRVSTMPLIQDFLGDHVVMCVHFSACPLQYFMLKK